MVLDDAIHARFARAYSATEALYYRGQPSFDAVLARIRDFADRL
jgi:hypothetical protein